MDKNSVGLQRDSVFAGERVIVRPVVVPYPLRYGFGRRKIKLSSRIDPTPKAGFNLRGNQMANAPAADQQSP